MRKLIPLCRRKDNDPLQLNSLGGVVVGVVVEIAFGEGVDVPGDGGRPFQHELVVRPSVHVAAKTAHLACVGVTQGYLHNVHQHEWDGLPVFTSTETVRTFREREPRTLSFSVFF